MSYYYVNVQILIESDNEVNARSDIESYIDNLVSNNKNKDLQDYAILECVEQEQTIYSNY